MRDLPCLQNIYKGAVIKKISPPKASRGNRTRDLFILKSTLYPLGHWSLFSLVKTIFEKSLVMIFLCKIYNHVFKSQKPTVFFSDNLTVGLWEKNAFIVIADK